jgi:uncharacterized protein YukE
MASQVNYPVGGYRNAPGVSPNPPGQAPSAPTGSPGTVSVDTELQQQAATDFSNAGEHVNSLYQGLNNTLGDNSAGGGPWGGDSLGQGFASSYLPAQQSALSALQNLAGLLSGIATNLGDTQQTYTQGNDVNNTLASGKA